jgi:uncharacterized DUF497 family protein
VRNRKDETNDNRAQEGSEKMADDGSDLVFLSPASFEWDDQKREVNLGKHGIDFDSAIEVFYGPVILHRSDRNSEERWTALGYSGNRLIVVVFTRRADVVRIISARRARKNEEREYRNAEMGRPP